MRRMTKSIIAIAVAGLFSVPAFAASEAEQSVNTKLQEVFKNKNDFEPHEMKEIGMNGIFRVKIKDGSYAFTDSQAQYIFNGDLILTKAKGLPEGQVQIFKHDQEYPDLGGQKDNQKQQATAPVTSSESTNNQSSDVSTNTSASTVTNRLLSAEKSQKEQVSSSDSVNAGLNAPKSTLISFDPYSVSYEKNDNKASGSIFYSRLPYESHAFDMTYGKGERDFTVFVDPDCPVCRDFDKTLKDNAALVNAKVHVFYVPLNIHPYARSHANFLWCQKDKKEAYTSWMDYIRAAQDKDPQVDDRINEVFEQWKKETNRGTLDKKCEADADAVSVSNFRMAASLGIKATPTIMFKNSAVVNSSVPADYLNEKLIYSEKHPKVDDLEKLTFPSTLLK